MPKVRSRGWRLIGSHEPSLSPSVAPQATYGDDNGPPPTALSVGVVLVDIGCRDFWFFLSTALGVIGGLIAFLFLLGRSFSAKRFGHHEATTAIVTSYYWHFVDVVWIALFAVIYLLR